MSRLVNDDEQYAKLLSSIKLANTHFRRTLSPIQAAELIQKLIDEESFESAESMLPLSKGSIRAYTNLLKPPEECKGGIIWGKSGDLGVGFSAARAIFTLKKKEDQILLFSVTAEKSISEKDVQEIISFYKKHDEFSLETVIEKVIDARPKKVTTHLVIVSISDNAKDKLKAKSYQMKKSSDEILQKCMMDKFQINNPDGIQIKNSNAAFVFNESEYKKYKTQVSKLGLEYDKITEYLVS